MVDVQRVQAPKEIVVGKVLIGGSRKFIFCSLSGSNHATLCVKNNGKYSFCLFCGV